MDAVEEVNSECRPTVTLLVTTCVPGVWCVVYRPVRVVASVPGWLGGSIVLVCGVAEGITLTGPHLVLTLTTM